MKNVITAIDKSGSYRVFLAITTDMVEEARKIHDTTPLASAGLGRVLTGAGLMSLDMKNPTDKLTVLFKGDGPAEQILATATRGGKVKGYIANPSCDLPLNDRGKLDVGGSLGIGNLTVIKDLGLKEPYVGTIALVDGEIADDLTAYYYISEQQNTAISLGVKVDTDWSIKAAGGMFIQMLPGGDEKAVDALEEMLADLPPITTIVEETVDANVGKSDEGVMQAMLERIFGSMPEDYKNVRKINWTDKGLWVHPGSAITKTLTAGILFFKIAHRTCKEPVSRKRETGSVLCLVDQPPR